jgi:hypothetical protein
VKDVEEQLSGEGAGGLGGLGGLGALGWMEGESRGSGESQAGGRSLIGFGRAAVARWLSRAGGALSRRNQWMARRLQCSGGRCRLRALGCGLLALVGGVRRCPAFVLVICQAARHPLSSLRQSFLDRSAPKHSIRKSLIPSPTQNKLSPGFVFGLSTKSIR